MTHTSRDISESIASGIDIIPNISIEHRMDALYWIALGLYVKSKHHRLIFLRGMINSSARHGAELKAEYNKRYGKTYTIVV